MKKYIITSAISLVVGIAIALLCFKSCETPSGTVTATSDTVYIVKTILHTDSIAIPKPYSVIQHDTSYIDTNTVINDYMAEKRYTLPYSDTNIIISNDIVIYKNALQSFKFAYKITQKEKIITNTITEVKIKKEVFSFQIGGGVNYNLITKKVGGNVAVGTTIQRNCIDANYDFTNKTITGIYKYKIFYLNK